jgi:predicted nuclease of restriction endonuclease-like RecB superfamily
MLTGQLIRARVRGATIEPSFIDPNKPALCDFAEQICACLHDAAQNKVRRSELDEALDQLYGDERQQKLLSGIVKIALDRCDFSAEPSIDPIELRRRVFLLAQERGPISTSPGPFGRIVAADIFDELSEQLGLSTEALSGSLYADLREAHQLIGHRLPSPEWLLRRYNVALVQSLLLRSLALEIHLETPSQPRLRQLFRYIKFHQLIHQASQTKKGLMIRLDGPTSLLRQSTRYGMALANFFPALLLQPGKWTLKATILWTKANHRKQLSLNSELSLHSHYQDTGAYESRTQQWFRERFEAIETSWTCKPSERPITLGDADVFMPDFTFTDGKRTAHLEIVGYWNPERLDTHLKALKAFGPGNVIVAVSRKLNGSKDVLDANPTVPVIDYAEVVPAKRVLKNIEEYAS